MNDYKKTLNLPETKFSMKGNLKKKEPEMLNIWSENKLYKLIRKKKSRKKIFFLHDGPPYANGNIHIGHAVNKILKDIIVKYKNLSGFDAPYIPSWDCHGLPIEQKIEKIYKTYKQLPIITFQQKCREYASEQIKKQKKDFIRLGILGDWKNAHLTMDFKNEANIIRTLSYIIKKKYLYRDLKPIYWCLKCTSALSEAEIEYSNKKSNSIIVSLKSSNHSHIQKVFNVKKLNTKIVNIPIWTTTPWTLPSSKAISVNPNFTYELIETKTCYLIIETQLTFSVLNALKINNWQKIRQIKGKFLEGLKFFHPFLKNIYLPIILGEHVNQESGTGAVHTAPDHGPDDYLVCQKYKIQTSNFVNSYGKFTFNVHPELDGINVFKSDAVIIKILSKHNVLLNHEIIEHNYPHCWRHKTPVIYRATPQWFIKIDHKKLRHQSLEETKKVHWIPKWGEKKIQDMIKKRPDWCISRQRKWGVPIAIFVHNKTNEMHPKTHVLMEKIAKKIEKNGIEIWWDTDFQEILGKDKTSYSPVFNVLDVWFDSGNTHTSIKYKNEKYSSNCADMYLEGSDQHRGWFMSSLILSTIKNSKAPYSEVLTHGFVVDQNGHKMSKSLGNTISPNDVANELGADVLRLWVASTNYSNDIAISKEILKNSSDSYRKIRNTARFMLANINDFQPIKHLLSRDKMLCLDQWAVGQTKIAQKEILDLYKKYKFNAVMKRIMYFCSIEMGSFYLDIIKDRQYTLQKNSQERRSSQTAIYYIINSLARWIAPILSFTADEIWSYLPERKSKHIFTEEWFDELFDIDENSIFNSHFWNNLIDIKNEINKFLEEQIKNKIIKNSLEICIILYVSKELFKKLKTLGKELKFVFLTSDAKIKQYHCAPKNSKISNTVDKFKISFEKINGKKCLRCWHYFPLNTKNSLCSSKICPRCILNTQGNGEKRIFI